MREEGIARHVVELLKACRTPRHEQRIRIGGIYLDMLLETLNEQGSRMGHKKLNAQNLVHTKYFGRPLDIVEGEDVLEVV